jgi:hypothetical protein
MEGLLGHQAKSLDQPTASDCILAALGGSEAEVEVDGPKTPEGAC